MMKHSSGILVYRNNNEKIEVLLCHMGGPFWQGIDEGAWSIPKGEYKTSEKAIDTAVREFKEETGFEITKQQLKFLGSKRQASNKLVTIFYTNHDYDASKATSNIFTKEWPKGSGVIKEFPEMDKAKWMNLEEAKKKILKGQIYFLEKLETKLTG